MKFRRTAALLALAMLLSTPAWGQTLEVGSKAPSIEVSNWIKGVPVDIDTVGGSQVTVVEFWATW